VDKIKWHGVHTYTYRALIIVRTLCVLSLSDIQSRSQIILSLFIVTVRRCKLVGRKPGHFKCKAKELPFGQGVKQLVALEENKNVPNDFYFTRYTSFEKTLPHEIKKITFYPPQDIR
jgi:hypothetical protein